MIREARERRNLVKDIAEHYNGAARTYDSGSIAHGTAKNPLPDADAVWSSIAAPTPSWARTAAARVPTS